MIKGFVFLLVVGVFFSLSGCTMDQVMGLKKEQQEQPIRYEPKPDLNAHENHSLQTWSQAAAMADDIGDCTTSILYYTKIVDYFPDTKEGEKAQSRLNEIRGKANTAQDEGSL